jgi:hypothetical protein
MNRNLVTLLLVVLLGVAACGGKPLAPHPTATTVQATEDTPQETLSVPSITTYELSVISAREAQSYTDGVFQTQKAPAGGKLIIVKVHERNTGNAASHLEEGNSNPFQLVDSLGRFYDTDVSWSESADFNPGLAQDDIYVFPVPSGVQPSHLAVNVTDPDSGIPFGGLLEFPGRPSD